MIGHLSVSLAKYRSLIGLKLQADSSYLDADTEFKDVPPQGASQQKNRLILEAPPRQRGYGEEALKTPIPHPETGFLKTENRGAKPRFWKMNFQIIFIISVMSPFRFRALSVHEYR